MHGRHSPPSVSLGWRNGNLKGPMAWSVLELHASSSGIPAQSHLGDPDLFVGTWYRLETTSTFFSFSLLFSSLLSFPLLCFTSRPFAFHCSLSGLTYTSDSN